LGTQFQCSLQADKEGCNGHHHYKYSYVNKWCYCDGPEQRPMIQCEECIGRVTGKARSGGQGLYNGGCCGAVIVLVVQAWRARTGTQITTTTTTCSRMAYVYVMLIKLTSWCSYTCRFHGRCIHANMDFDTDEFENEDYLCQDCVQNHGQSLPITPHVVMGDNPSVSSTKRDSNG